MQSLERVRLGVRGRVLGDYLVVGGVGASGDVTRVVRGPGEVGVGMKVEATGSVQKPEVSPGGQWCSYNMPAVAVHCSGGQNVSIQHRGVQHMHVAGQLTC